MHKNYRLGGTVILFRVFKGMRKRAMSLRAWQRPFVDLSFESE